MDKLRALRYFKRVVELNSFSAVAAEFSVPASSVSRRIKDLEASLGIELVKRTTRHVSITDLGQLYYQHIDEVLSKLTHADELLSQSMDNPSGTLKVSAPPGLAQALLVPLFRHFRLQFPNILLDLDYTNEYALFGQDSVDLAIRGGPVDDARLIARPLIRSGFTLWAQTRLADKLNTEFGTTRWSLDQLCHCPSIMFRSRSAPVPWWAQEGDDWLPVSINPVLISNDSTTLLDALAHGEGLLLAPDWLIPTHLKNEVTPVAQHLSLSPGKTHTVEINLVYQHAKYQLPNIKLSVDFICDYMSTHAVDMVKT
ncbi:LysR family transcriptional regulator [Pseudoalteromonas sp. OOF1S-7]|uniref:LysR family transcriptional regulator n=1 Tax=Pseudoalteromonas sp. OOF1S-7 TaxID=2917757 RepID=UPI001EF69555|nr:LysR family transcriptional regulator [Pseudoalteromonas sp. OOF1S-7]MCG7535542.1 LysR family transcriptional regulator [Pseudoalteromonas sp. OOF1S-7]